MVLNMEMDNEEMSQKFTAAVALMNSGKSQECVDIWMDLAEFGHLDSIEQIVYIVLDRKEFQTAENYIDLAANSKAPIILYLKARLIEERDGLKAAMESFKEAAAAGNPNSISLMFDFELKACNFENAQMYLNGLRGHEDFLSRLNEPTTIERLSQELDRRRKFFQNLSGFTREEKVFTIAVGSDDTDTYLEIRVYDYFNKELVEIFGDDLVGAIDFCHSKDRGFEVIYVGDTWDIENKDIVYHCRVNWNEQTITISENYEDYWFGTLKDVELAIEELINKDFDWDLVNYIKAEVRSEEKADDELDSEFVELSPGDFNLAGSFKVISGRVYVGDPSEVGEYLKKSPEDNDVWNAFEGLSIFDFDEVSSTVDKTGIVYVEKNEDGQNLRVLISFDGEFKDELSTEEFVAGNWLSVSSGQLMVGDHAFLDKWDTSDGEEWNLDGKIGNFSYQGASATTIAHGFGTLADGESVVFSTGYGDGNYNVFFQIKNESGQTLGFSELQEAGYTSWLNGFGTGVPPGCEISKVVIDFITEVE
jgi:hypothetical protein